MNEVDEHYRWKNTCAVRLSYILNESGLKVPAIPGKTVSGSDGSQYFFRVRDLNEFLILSLGKPEVVSGDVRSPAGLKGRKGIVLFDISGWTDASGHASLFDGNGCYDACYFYHPQGAYQTNNIFFGSLNDFFTHTAENQKNSLFFSLSSLRFWLNTDNVSCSRR
ncbi:MAG TPA: type VI secretion system amidase effector protein Tae4 [Oligella sp.]|nr:type VI secretion system amidase effector protein Tae4 [Oligella sp.]